MPLIITRSFGHKCAIGPILGIILKTLSQLSIISHKTTFLHSIPSDHMPSREAIGSFSKVIDWRPIHHNNAGLKPGLKLNLGLLMSPNEAELSEYVLSSPDPPTLRLPLTVEENNSGVEITTSRAMREWSRIDCKHSQGRESKSSNFWGCNFA